MPRGKYERTVEHSLNMSEALRRYWAKLPKDHPRKKQAAKAFTTHRAAKMAEKISSVLKKHKS